MSLKLGSKKNDPFEHLLNPQPKTTGSSDSSRPRSSSLFLQRVISSTSSIQKTPTTSSSSKKKVSTEEYLSPFRSNLVTNNKAYIQNEKTKRFPTVSATSNYTNRTSKEMGFKKIPKDKNFAKDIFFPSYLTQNEQRQQIELTKLVKLEKDLQYKKDSQNIIDLTKQPSQSQSPSPLDDSANAEKPPLEKPIDPKLTPMVSFQLSTPPVNNKNKKTQVVPEEEEKERNPKATPNSKEEIVKTKKFGILSKSIYDQLQYDQQQHEQYLASYKAEMQEKYDVKMQEYENELKSLDEKIVASNELIEQCKKDTDAKLDIMNAELVKRMFDERSVQTDDKMKIFSETKLIKREKIDEKINVEELDDQVVGEIDQLNKEKEKVYDEFNEWTFNMTNIAEQLDAKLFKIKQINITQMNLQNKIDGLNNEKLGLTKEIEANKFTHANNVETIENVDNKQYLPKLNNIDSQINDLLNQLTLIKQENANEKIQLSELTQKLEKERMDHEEKLKLDAEERKRQEENLLGKQREELEQKANDLQLNHETEMTNLKTSYEQQLADFKSKLMEQQDKVDDLKLQKSRLEGSKAIEDQDRQKQSDNVLKNEILSKQHQQAEAYNAVQLAQKKKNASPVAEDLMKESHIPALSKAKDDSLFEYETEEEIMYV
ncbi:uncharacterized protein NDAI_0G00940 [Naumovozyma dairenensis CBS 421]|uniref:Uncharacterized protein n=1 Tax=Naumovozyma dairenensis (strain ATCC 10597 / BCRC 20456 / CBS 421 / NBRC 0211 / NRRL Y-12639) TaxID=1071378 RepID=G0WDK9_NAUDC|nr:hypothetical protein NDAI_0G00940 [Naumovozyma dairenensis CBS 421]CCD25870.2 hypothetical protein NDAI_0G00940 [Naumovozyma dairenensis CBS 421]